MLSFTFWKLIGEIATKALFSFKKIQDSSSHRILRHMYGALNIDENKN